MTYPVLTGARARPYHYLTNTTHTRPYRTASVDKSPAEAGLACRKGEGGGVSEFKNSSCRNASGGVGRAVSLLTYFSLYVPI